MTATVTADTSEIIITVTDTSVNVNVCENVVEVVTGSSGPQGPTGSSILSGSIDPLLIIGRVGDLYINVTSGYMFGPKTESGWGEGSLLGNGLEVDDVAYVHYQTTASNIWEIVHTLGFKPNITVVDLAGNVILGDYKYQGNNSIIATFSQEITGTAYLS